VYEFDRGLAKAYVTVVLTFPVSGVLCSLMLTYSCKRITYDITKRVPDDMVAGHSPAGWMTVQVFCAYAGNVFTPHLGKYSAKFSVAVYIDGHRIHLTYQLSKLCTALAIILMSVYPSSTRLLQSLDVAALENSSPRVE
jgi:hypothetical protein